MSSGSGRGPGAAGPGRIVLVGFMAAGKTTVGRGLAERLGWGFRDLDTWIESQTGLSVPELFAERGESAFRALERDAARAAAQLGEHVIAAGGGAFAQPDTRELLRAGAVTVWLRCRLETVLARVGDGRGRPLARSRETIERLFAEREPSYRTADLAVDADREPPEELTERLIREIFGSAAESRAGGVGGR